MNRENRFVGAAVVLSLALFAAPLAAQPFDGYATFSQVVNSYLESASTTSPQPVGAGTWEAWVKLTEIPTPGQCWSLFGKGWTVAYWIGTCGDTTPHAVLRSYTHGVTSPSNIDFGTLPLGTWTHIAVTADGALRRHYINGVLVGTATDTLAPAPSTAPFRIGSDISYNLHPSAQIDEVRIWTVARTEAEIRGWMKIPITTPVPGLISVFPLSGNGFDTNGGTANSASAGTTAVAYGTTNLGTKTFFVPVVLKNQYSSEMTFTNRGNTAANVTVLYTATAGNGSGSISFSLAAGHQRVEPDAIEFLRTQGLAIDTDGLRIGTLRVTFDGISSNDAASVTERIATDTTSPVGRAGFSCAGVPVARTFTSPVVLPGIRFGATTVRTNLAVQNAGVTGDGSVTLRVTLNDSTGAIFNVLPDIVLLPGAFHQYSSSDMGLIEGFVGTARVERVSGAATFYTYAAQNDQINSDGSFIPPLDPAAATNDTDVIPSIVETGTFSSEIVVANTGDAQRNVSLKVLCPSCPADAASTFLLGPHETRLFPDLLGSLRGDGVALPSPLGVAVGTLKAADGGESNQDVVAFARTSSIVGAQGAFGLAYPALRNAEISPGIAWISTAQQNETNRSNLAVVNAGDIDDGPIGIRLEIWDGATGTKVATVDDPTFAAIPVLGFVQLNAYLRTYAPATPSAFVKVIRTSGNNGFITYGVTNDGGNPGERTGDGTFYAMDIPYR